MTILSEKEENKEGLGIFMVWLMVSFERKCVRWFAQVAFGRRRKGKMGFWFDSLELISPWLFVVLDGLVAGKRSEKDEFWPGWFFFCGD